LATCGVTVDDTNCSPFGDKQAYRSGATTAGAAGDEGGFTGETPSHLSLPDGGFSGSDLGLEALDHAVHRRQPMPVTAPRTLPMPWPNEFRPPETMHIDAYYGVGVREILKCPHPARLYRRKAHRVQYFLIMADGDGIAFMFHRNLFQIALSLSVSRPAYACWHRAWLKLPYFPMRSNGSAAFSEDDFARLTALQRLIVKLILRGHRNLSISLRLGITEGTAKIHRKAI
jgi:hypothetical protein